MNKFINCLKNIITIFLTSAIILLLLGVPFMVLWNWFICDILNTGFQHITFWQSCGITLLINIIFYRHDSK